MRFSRSSGGYASSSLLSPDVSCSGLFSACRFSLASLFARHCSIGVPTWTYHHHQLALINPIFQYTGPYHAARRSHSLRLTPKLIPISLDIIHPIQNHKCILPQHPLRSCIRNPPRHLLSPRVIVDAPWVRGIVCWYDGDFVAWAGGVDCAGGEEVVLGFLEEGGDLGRAVG